MSSREDRRIEMWFRNVSGGAPMRLSGYAYRLTKLAPREYPSGKATNWMEVAQKMAQAARAGLALEKKRLQEIIADRQAKKPSASRQ